MLNPSNSVNQAKGGKEEILYSKWESTDKSLIGFFSGGRKQVRVLVKQDGALDLQTVEQSAASRFINLARGAIGLEEIGVVNKDKQHIEIALPNQKIDQEKERQILKRVLISKNPEEISAEQLIRDLESVIQESDSTSTIEKNKTLTSTLNSEIKSLKEEVNSCLENFMRQEGKLLKAQKEVIAPYSGFTALSNEFNEKKERFTRLRDKNEWGFPSWFGIKAGVSFLSLDAMNPAQIQGIRQAIKAENAHLERLSIKLEQAADLFKGWASQKKAMQTAIDGLKSASIPQYAKAYAQRMFLERLERDLMCKVRRAGAKDLNPLIQRYLEAQRDLYFKMETLSKDTNERKLIEQLQEVTEGTEESHSLKRVFVGELDLEIKKFQTAMTDLENRYNRPIGVLKMGDLMRASLKKVLFESQSALNVIGNDKHPHLTQSAPPPSLNTSDLLLRHKNTMAVINKSRDQLLPYQSAIDRLSKANTEVETVKGGLSHQIQSFYSSAPPQFLYAQKLKLILQQIAEQEAFIQPINTLKQADEYAKSFGSGVAKMHAALAEAQKAIPQTLVEQMTLIETDPSLFSIREPIRKKYIESVAQRIDAATKEIDLDKKCIRECSQKEILSQDCVGKIEFAMDLLQKELVNLKSESFINVPGSFFRREKNIVKPVKKLEGSDFIAWERNVAEKIAEAASLKRALQLPELVKIAESFHIANEKAQQKIGQLGDTLPAGKILQTKQSIGSKLKHFQDSLGKAFMSQERGEERLGLIEIRMTAYVAALQEATSILQDSEKIPRSLVDEQSLYLLRTGTEEYLETQKSLVLHLHEKIDECKATLVGKKLKLFKLPGITLQESFKNQIIEMVNRNPVEPRKQNTNNQYDYNMTPTEFTSYRLDVDSHIDNSLNAFEQRTHLNTLERALTNHNEQKQKLTELRDELINVQKFDWADYLDRFLDVQTEQIKKSSHQLGKSEQLEQCALAHERAARAMEAAVKQFSDLLTTEKTRPLIVQLQHMERNSTVERPCASQNSYKLAKQATIEAIQSNLKLAESSLRDLVQAQYQSNNIDAAKRITSFAQELLDLQDYFPEPRLGGWSSHKIHVSLLTDSKAIQSYSAYAKKKLHDISLTSL